MQLSGMWVLKSYCCYCRHTRDKHHVINPLNVNVSTLAESLPYLHLVISGLWLYHISSSDIYERSLTVWKQATDLRRKSPLTATRGLHVWCTRPKTHTRTHSYKFRLWILCLCDKWYCQWDYRHPHHHMNNNETKDIHNNTNINI